jgi:hypothetical protein
MKLQTLLDHLFEEDHDEVELNMMLFSKFLKSYGFKSDVRMRKSANNDQLFYHTYVSTRKWEMNSGHLVMSFVIYHDFKKDDDSAWTVELDTYEPSTGLLSKAHFPIVKHQGIAVTSVIPMLKKLLKVDVAAYTKKLDKFEAAFKGGK